LRIRKAQLAIVVILAGTATALVSSAGMEQDAPPAKEAKRDAAVDEKTIAALITQLGDGDYDKREAAHKQLAKVGEAALPALRKAAKASADAEVKLRAMQLAQDIAATFFV